MLLPSLCTCLADVPAKLSKSCECKYNWTKDVIVRPTKTHKQEEYDILETFLIISHYENKKFDQQINTALYYILMQPQSYQNHVSEVFHTPNISILVFQNPDSRKVKNYFDGGLP